jgi:hypothetical protein
MQSMRRNSLSGNPQMIQTRRRTSRSRGFSQLPAAQSPTLAVVARTASRLLCAWLLGVGLTGAAAAASDRTPPAVQPATDFAAVEVHADEQLAIAAEPYDTKEKIALFRVDYLSHGVLPIRLIVTNNSDHPISLRDARILFVTAHGDRIQAAEPDDVERLMTLKEKEGAKIPLPGGLPPIKRKPKASDKQIEQDFDTFEFQALVVEAHTTRAGFLFYDVGGLTRPLKGALLNLHSIKNSNGKELFYFEIPFDKYLKTKSSEMN